MMKILIYWRNIFSSTLLTVVFAAVPAIADVTMVKTEVDAALFTTKVFSCVSELGAIYVSRINIVL